MYIGIDLGTSSVKTILVNHLGKIISEASETYALLMPKPLWTEQNPQDWFDAALKALKRIIKGYEKDVKSISFSGQMHGAVILDEHDQVIRPAILWNDQRTVNEVDYLNTVVGKEKLLSETGNIALTGFTLPKLMWISKHEPYHFERIDKIMLPKDYIAYRLSGVFATDVSDISGTLLYSVEKRKYSQFMMDILKIHQKMLPKVYESSEVIGTISSKIADELGMSRLVKIIIGGGDQAVGAIGTGTVKKDDMNISLGTSGVVFVASDIYLVDRITYLHAFAHANKKYHLMGVTLAAAGSMQWWKENMFLSKTYRQLEDEMKETPIDDTLYYLPYLSGERSPINNPHAKATFVGFTLNHQSKHFTRAIMEGVTYSLKQCYDVILRLGIYPQRIRVTGGGAKNEIWCQMIADCFDATVETINVQEGPALGAAMLAMVGDRLFEHIDEACDKIIHVDKKFIPHEKNVLLYRKKYQNYLRLYQDLKGFFETIDNTS